MLTSLDHLALAVADSDAAAASLAAALGLEPGGGGRHEGHGTFNRLVWLGDTYLELIAVFDAPLAAASWIGAPTLRALERGGGLATWAIASDALDGDVRSLLHGGADLARPAGGERTRPDGTVVRWRLSAPPRLDPATPFLIEHEASSAEWTPADRAARASGPARLEVLELEVEDVNRTIQRLLRSVGLRFRPSLAGGGARDAHVGSQLVRLRPARASSAGLATIHLSIAGAEAREVELLGCRWRIRAVTD